MNLYWVWACLFAMALAHGGHEAVPEGESISKDPIVRDPPVYSASSSNMVRTARYGLI